MPDTKSVSRKELTATEVLALLEEGTRVAIEVSVVGTTMMLIIRELNGTYYCDTPIKLMKHETPEELRACLEKFRLVRTETVDEADSSAVTA